MCVVSMVGDHWNDKWDPLRPNLPQYPFSPNPSKDPFEEFQKYFQKPVTREEFDQLKKEVEDLKKLLQRAKEYDEKNNEPNCEIEEKMKFLKEVAKLVGIDLDEVLKPKTNGS